MSRDLGKERVIAMIGDAEMHDFEWAYGRQPSMNDDDDLWLLAAILISNMRARIDNLEFRFVD